MKYLLLGLACVCFIYINCNRNEKIQSEIKLEEEINIQKIEDKSIKKEDKNIILEIKEEEINEISSELELLIKLNTNNEQLNLEFDSISYHYDYEGGITNYQLLDYQIDEINIILSKDSWEIENNPEGRGLPPGYYTLKNQGRIIAFINNNRDNVIIIIKDLITGGNIAVYYAPHNVFNDIKNFISNNFNEN